MAGRLSDAWLDELRSRANLEEIVSEYVPLKQKGRRFWGCCPFHNEKTPSFSVDSEAQMYYCFGCHKGGTVINFVMEMERMEFMDAVRLLADRAHMEIPEQSQTGSGRISPDERERIYEANTLAARFFHSTLWTGEGAEALNYLYKRGLNDSDIRRFGLGAAPKGWDALQRHMAEQGFDDALLEMKHLFWEFSNAYNMESEFEWEKWERSGYLNIQEVYAFVVKNWRKLHAQIQSGSIRVSYITRNAMLFIKNHFRQSPSVCDVAEYVHVSPSHLSHVFNRETQRSIPTFVLECRMRETVRLLENTDLKTGEIAEKIGIENVSYFLRVFKKTYGTTPQEYRQMYEKNR